MVVENIEADDTIAFIVNNPLDGEKNEYYIMSSDKDFYQLISHNVKIWSPTKKKLYEEKDILEEYGISPSNFVLYRMLDGDISDNINGLRGFGLKTIRKKFPFLSEQKISTVDDILEFSRDKKEKIYETVINSKDIIERNYKLMSLRDVNISGSAKIKIIDMLRKPIPQLDTWNFQVMVLEDYINACFPSLEYWLSECFNSLNSYGMKYAK